MTQYASRCAITSCDVPDVLEAAHLGPYRGPESNISGNGLLLRADLHTLLYLRLLAIGPNRRVILSRTLRGTQYADLDGAPLAEPQHPSARPDQSILDSLLDLFRTAESAR